MSQTAAITTSGMAIFRHIVRSRGTVCFRGGGSSSDAVDVLPCRCPSNELAGEKEPRGEVVCR